MEHVLQSPPFKGGDVRVSGRGGYQGREATLQMFAKRTALKSGGSAASIRWLRVVSNHPGAGAPPLLEKEGNVSRGNRPRPKST
jgi:hypothetical protein